MKKIIKIPIIAMFLLVMGALMVGSVKWYNIGDNTQIGLSKIKDYNVIFWNTTEPIYGDIEHDYTCGTDYFNYTTNPKYAWCWDYLPSNQSYTLIFGHSFLGGNIPLKTIWWNKTEQIGTEIIEHNKTECIDLKKANIYLNKSGTITHWICDYSAWGDCRIDEDNRRLICDSDRDGNGDGFCQSGESCFIVYLEKNTLRKIKNIGFHTVLEKYNIECVRQ